MKPTHVHSDLHLVVSWTPPHIPSLKINYDRAVFRDSNNAGIRAMIRDSEGRVIASLAEKIPLAQTVANVEAAVARRTILFAKDLNLSSIILEGDSEIIHHSSLASRGSVPSFLW